MKTAKIFKSQEWRSLFVGVFLAAITSLLLWTVIKTAIPSEIGLVLITIAGMTTSAALSAFKQFYQGGLAGSPQIYVEQYGGGSVVNITQEDAESQAES